MAGVVGRSLGTRSTNEKAAWVHKGSVGRRWRPWTGVVDFSVFKTFSFDFLIFFFAQDPGGKGNLGFLYGFDITVSAYHEVALIDKTIPLF